MYVCVRVCAHNIYLVPITLCLCTFAQVATRCFVPQGLAQFTMAIASFCATCNHWCAAHAALPTIVRCPAPTAHHKPLRIVCALLPYRSNHVTSMAYVKDVFVPYCKATIERLRSADPAACRPFGEQVRRLPLIYYELKLCPLSSQYLELISS